MKKLVIAFSLLSTTALAQTTPIEQAMGAKIMQEVNAGLACSVNLLNVQADLVKAQARVKELEAKQPSK